jgi:hypothetical protein
MSIMSIIKAQQQIASRAAGTRSQVQAWADATIRGAEAKIAEQVTLHLGENGYRAEAKDLRLGHWACKESPTGACVYDITDDPDCDYCLYCGDSNERK